MMSKNKPFQEVEVFFLEMEEVPNYDVNLNKSFTIEKLCKPIDAETYLNLYKGVGDAFQWTDRLAFSPSQLEEIINDDKTQVYVLKYDHKIVGFSELTCESKEVEILYFGLLTTEIGKGYGPQLLQKMIMEAWSFLPTKVKLNTCSLDHPKALSLYKKMGFKVKKTLTKPVYTSLPEN